MKCYNLRLLSCGDVGISVFKVLVVAGLMNHHAMGGPGVQFRIQPVASTDPDAIINSSDPLDPLVIMRAGHAVAVEVRISSWGLVNQAELGGASFELNNASFDSGTNGILSVLNMDDGGGSCAFPDAPVAFCPICNTSDLTGVYMDECRNRCADFDLNFGAICNDVTDAGCNSPSACDLAFGAIPYYLGNMIPPGLDFHDTTVSPIEMVWATFGDGALDDGLEHYFGTFVLESSQDALGTFELTPSLLTAADAVTFLPIPLSCDTPMARIIITIPIDIVFTNPTQFEPLVSDLNALGDEDFVELLVNIGPSLSDLMDDPLDEFTDNGAFFPGEMIPGMSMQSNIDAPGSSGSNPRGINGLSVFTPTFFGINAPAVANFLPPDSLDILIGQALPESAGSTVKAVSMEVINFLAGTTMEVRVFDTAEQLISAKTVSLTQGGPLFSTGFVGIIIPDGSDIGRINLWSPDGGEEGLQSISLFGQQTGEIPTLSQWGTLVMGLLLSCCGTVLFGRVRDTQAAA